MRKRKILMPLLSILFSLPLSAAFANDQPPRNSLAKIYFNAGVNRQTVQNLINTIDEINNNGDVKNIYIYLNSYGGDMDSGNMAAAAIRSSKTPITTIAMSTVGSAGTLMLCAVDDRRGLPDTSIYLHSAVVGVNKELRPNDTLLIQTELNKINNWFRKAYQGCTNFSDAEIDTILKSEDNRKTLTADQAVKAGVIGKIDPKIADAQYSYPIIDTADKN